LGSSDVGLEDSSSSLNQQSAISNQQSEDPVATARGSDTTLIDGRDSVALTSNPEFRN